MKYHKHLRLSSLPSPLPMWNQQGRKIFICLYLAPVSPLVKAQLFKLGKLHELARPDDKTIPQFTLKTFINELNKLKHADRILFYIEAWSDIPSVTYQPHHFQTHLPRHFQTPSFLRKKEMRKIKIYTVRNKRFDKSIAFLKSIFCRLWQCCEVVTVPLALLRYTFITQ